MLTYTVKVHTILWYILWLSGQLRYPLVNFRIFNKSVINPFFHHPRHLCCDFFVCLFAVISLPCSDPLGFQTQTLQSRNDAHTLEISRLLIAV